MYGYDLPARISQSSLNFSFKDLKKATCSFSLANKIGQGSNGTVYKVHTWKLIAQRMLIVHLFFLYKDADPAILQRACHSDVVIICVQAVLPGGNEVAAKRLFLNTKQCINQFFNEVDVISQVRHKNSVKLLGCSVDGPESFLIFEYHYRRLDLFIFGKYKAHFIPVWCSRLLFLHGL